MDPFISGNTRSLDRDMVARFLPISYAAADEQLQSNIEEFNEEVARVNGDSVRVAR